MMYDLTSAVINTPESAVGGSMDAVGRRTRLPLWFSLVPLIDTFGQCRFKWHVWSVSTGISDFSWKMLAYSLRVIIAHFLCIWPGNCDAHTVDLNVREELTLALVFLCGCHWRKRRYRSLTNRGPMVREASLWPRGHRFKPRTRCHWATGVERLVASSVRESLPLSEARLNKGLTKKKKKRLQNRLSSLSATYKKHCSTEQF